MIRFVLAFAIMAGPALAADCDTARQTVAPLTARREEANTRTKTYIEDDELVEVTPQSIRIRKRALDPHERKRQSRVEAD